LAAVTMTDANLINTGPDAVERVLLSMPALKQQQQVAHEEKQVTHEEEEVAHEEEELAHEEEKLAHEEEELAHEAEELAHQEESLGEVIPEGPGAVEAALGEEEEEPQEDVPIINAIRTHE